MIDIVTKSKLVDFRDKIVEASELEYAYSAAQEDLRIQSLEYNHSVQLKNLAKELTKIIHGSE